MDMKNAARASRMRKHVGTDEWQQRVHLAACYRLVALYGWDDLIFTHILARVPGAQHHFLINPYGLMFSEITASSLVKINLDVQKVDDSPYDINPTGFTIHSAVHAAREDANCVLHVHSVNGVAISAQVEGVLPLSQHSILVLSSLGYHDYEGVALDAAPSRILTKRKASQFSRRKLNAHSRIQDSEGRHPGRQ